LARNHEGVCARQLGFGNLIRPPTQLFFFLDQRSAGSVRLPAHRLVAAVGAASILLW
jgi:hypothetical protein